VNAVSRFDANRRKRSRRGFQNLPEWAPAVLYAAGTLVAVMFLFQVFFRYAYFQNNGLLWRVDRLTQHMCRYNPADGSCIAPKRSSSTSVSTSTSTSVSLKSSSKPKHH
jgi:hypothetical protein